MLRNKYFRTLLQSALAVVLLSACSDDEPLRVVSPSGGTAVAISPDNAVNEASSQVMSSDQDTGGNQNNTGGNDQSSGSQSGTGTSDNTNTQAGSDQTTSQPTLIESVVGGDPRAAEITEVVLVTGQSNALGNESSYDQWLDTPHPRAFAFTDKGWQVADLHQVWDLNWHPRNYPETDPSNNFGFHFARKVAQRRPDRVVGFILVTKPGAGISNWDYESEFYLKIRNKVVTALNELPNKATIDGILWHQGETDWAVTDYYSAKLNDVIRNFRGESWFGDNRPFICGETIAAPVNSILMALNDDGDPWTGCVESDVVSGGIRTIIDGLHFSADGLRILGTRYATKYLQMTE